MITLEVTEMDKISLQKDLAIALVNLSQGKLNNLQANDLAKVAINNIDLRNSTLAHKGINWFAKKIINMLDFDTLVCRV